MRHNDRTRSNQSQHSCMMQIFLAWPLEEELRRGCLAGLITAGGGGGGGWLCKWTYSSSSEII